MKKSEELNQRVSAARRETEARGETFYPGPSRIHLAAFPPKERWDDWVELDSRAWPWGVDGHNSHTNVCSSNARAGYQFWMGLDRPSPDHANAEVVFLISSHLEAGHYFNPHAQRVIEARAAGAKIIVFDTRLSNTATHADYWLAPYPGSEAAIVLAMANYLIQNDLYNREFVRRWWNWEEYMAVERPEAETNFENF